MLLRAFFVCNDGTGFASGKRSQIKTGLLSRSDRSSSSRRDLRDYPALLR
jgi:hypothetical protein